MDRTVTLALEAVPLRQALEAIAGEAGLNLAFSAERVTLDRAVTLDARPLPAREALRRVLTGTGLRARATAHHLYIEPDPNARSSRPPPTGTLRGTVYDGDTGDPLPGATVLIESLRDGDQTSVDGQYRITHVPAGTYDVQVSFVGFATKTVTGVEVRADETTVLDVTLTATTEELGEVVVTAERQAGSTAAVLSERRTAASVVDVMSAEELAVSGGDVASAIKRVAGAEVQDGKYVKVRGFGDRYGKVTVNGIPVPSIEPDRKAVPLDIMATDVISSVSVTKGWTPDLPADFAGALIDLRTKDAPTETTLSFSADTKYNTVTSLQNGLTIGGCNDTWTGFSNCYTFPEYVLAPDSVGLSGAAVSDGRSDYLLHPPFDTKEATEKAAEDIAAVMPIAPSERTLPLGQGYELSGGTEVDVFGRPLGLLAVGSYSSEHQRYQDYSYYGPFTGARFGEVRQAEQKIRLTALTSATFQVSDAHEVGATALYTRRTEDISQIQEGIWSPTNEQTLAMSMMNQRVNSSLFSGQLRGEHRLFGRATASWAGAYSRTRRLEPATLPVLYSNLYGKGPHQANNLVSEVRQNGIPDSVVVRFRRPPNTGISTNLRYHSDLNDDAYAGKLDLTFPFRVAGRRVEVKTGAFADVRTRDHLGRRFAFINLFPKGSVTARRVPESLFIPEHLVGVAGGRDTTTAVGIATHENTLRADNYDASVEVYAGYLMLDAEPIPGFRVVGGVRVVDSRQHVETYPLYNSYWNVRDAIEGGQAFTDWLPAVHLRYRIASGMHVRVGYSKTTARPQFREFIPFLFNRRVGAELISGNEDLKRSLIDNFDVRWEWYPVPEAAVSLGAYYKHFLQPVEVLGYDDLFRFLNTGEANTYGFEADLRLPLGLVYEPLDDLAVRGNASLLRTRVGPFVFADDFTESTTGTVIEGEERALFGQTPVLLNAGVTYERDGWGTSATVLYRYTGRQFRRMSLTRRTFRNPSSDLDFTVEQRLFRGWSLGLEISNLLGNEVRYTLESKEFVSNPEYDESKLGVPPSIVTEDYTRSEVNEAYNRGRTIELSLSWTMN